MTNNESNNGEVTNLQQIKSQFTFVTGFLIVTRLLT